MNECNEIDVIITTKSNAEKAKTSFSNKKLFYRNLDILKH